MENKKTALSSLPLKKSTALSYNFKDLRSSLYEVHSSLKQLSLNLTPAEVAEVALYNMILLFDQGDVIKKSVREAYFINNGIVRFPTVTTEFSVNNSATSATLNGYVIEDGGADVTTRGIAWATFYNPTTDDYSETSGTGTGAFTVTLEGLTDGSTYYARTYATNNAGTAYGNCISFIAQSTVGIEENKLFGQDLNIYPNPASAITSISFQLELPESMLVKIVDLKGQVVVHHELGSLQPGKNQIELDLSSLQNGIYICQLTNNGTIKLTHMLFIAR